MENFAYTISFLLMVYIAVKLRTVPLAAMDTAELNGVVNSPSAPNGVNRPN